MNLVFAVYLLENEILVLSRGGAFAPYFKVPPWVFCINARPLRGAFAAFPKQNDKCPGEWARLELTEPLMEHIVQRIVSDWDLLGLHHNFIR